LIADNALNDEGFVRAQLSCLKGGKCDEIGRKIKRIAPEILRDRCPPPCNECNKKQFRKIMSTLARKYPRELQQIMKSLNG